jgi:hypothetical protein
MQRYTPRRTRSVGAVSLQEALRTLGLGLEVNKVGRVELTVNPSGIQMATTSAYGIRKYTWQEIGAQSRAQQEHRRAQPRSAPWMDPAALTRWSVLLRVVGQLLDAQGVSDCVIDAAVAAADSPEGCRVQVTTEERAVLDSEAVRLQLLRLRTKYIEARDQGPEPEPSRPWWAFWRRE